MFKMLAALTTTLVLLSTGAVPAQAASPEAGLKPDEAPIKYVDRAPREGTPQAAMLNLVLWREEGRTREAAELISKQCPDWLREGMLTPDGPMNKETLSYQLREFTPDKALVSVDYNTADGTFKGWTRTVILEDGKWVVR
jgi:hypothetical protein